MFNFKALKIILPIFIFFIFAAPALAIPNGVNPVRNSNEALVFAEVALKNESIVGYAQNVISNGVNVYFFYGDDCPHCVREEAFLNELEEKNKNINIHRYKVWNNQKNADFLSSLADKFGWNVQGVPFTVVGKKTFSGFYDAATTGEQIKTAINDCLINKNYCADIIAGEIQGVSDDGKIKEKLGEWGKIYLPFFGETNIKNLSLPVLTAVIAVLDGLNPCAMWILLFLISLLLGTGDRKKMWAVGLTFIFMSAVFYFGVLASWLHILLVVGFIAWIRIGIALVALIAGGYSLRRYWLDRQGTCEVIDEGKRKNLFGRLKSVVAKNLTLAVLGTAALAISVNFIELVCSAGLPAVYTQVLAMSKLPNWQYYAYLAFYSFIFILGQLIVFLTAMFTLKLKAVGARYVRWTRLFGGIIMVLIGLLLLFRPAWLMFG